MLMILCDTTEECTKQPTYFLSKILPVNFNTFMYVTPHVQRTVKKMCFKGTFRFTYETLGNSE